MITARHAMLRQAQEYFHMLLLGTVKWDDVVVDKPIPIPAVRGNREQGKVRDLVVARSRTSTGPSGRSRSREGLIQSMAPSTP